MKTSLALMAATLALSNMNQASVFAGNQPAIVPYDKEDLFRSKNKTGLRKRDLTKIRSKRKIEKHSRRTNRG